MFRRVQACSEIFLTLSKNQVTYDRYSSDAFICCESQNELEDKSDDIIPNRREMTVKVQKTANAEQNGIMQDVKTEAGFCKTAGDGCLAIAVFPGASENGKYNNPKIQIREKALQAFGRSEVAAGTGNGVEDGACDSGGKHGYAELFQFPLHFRVRKKIIADKKRHEINT